MNKIEALEESYLRQNGGFLNQKNVLKLSKLRYLGKERIQYTKPRVEATTCNSCFNSESEMNIKFHTVNETYESNPDVWAVPAGMSGGEFYDELLTIKLNSMKNMNYFEAKKLATELGCDLPHNVKKEVLFVALETKKIELAQKKEAGNQAKKSARPEFATGSEDLSEGQKANYSNEAGEIEEVEITKVCGKMAEFIRTDGSKKWSVYKFLQLL